MYLKANDGTYLFRGAAPEDIAAAVCADHGYPVKALAATGVPLDRKFTAVRLDQIIRTAYSLASEQTGERYAIRMTPEGLEIKILDQSGGSINLRPRSNLMEATTTRSIENMCNSVGIYDEYGTRLTSIQDQEAIALYGLMERHVRQGEDEGRPRPPPFWRTALCSRPSASRSWATSASSPGRRWWWRSRRRGSRGSSGSTPTAIPGPWGSIPAA